ncbi:hypothetical protein JCM11641_000135 [Rhodosporidiobolus odoratus]
MLDYRVERFSQLWDLSSSATAQMAAPPGPLAAVQLHNAVQRPVTRSTSNLAKEVHPPPADEPSEDEMQEDDLVLAPLPSRSQDADLSSQTRQQLARPGSSALDDRVSAPADEDEEAAYREAYGKVEQSVKDDMDAQMQDAPDWMRINAEDFDPRSEDADDFGDEGEEDEEGEEEVDDSRSEGELAVIGAEMDGLERAVPGLLNKYHLIDRLGEGTFSSVYKAIDLQHHSFDNSLWQPVERKGKVHVAVKRIYVTSSPMRIHNELEILHELRGARNVAYLIDAIRHEDQVLAVMPFNRHQDFRAYYRTASLPMLRSYFSCLFRALFATHNLQIIHRDVKPANFLYDVTTGEGVLCDYGLAQNIGGDEWFEWKSDCLHSLPGPNWGGLDGRARAQRRMERHPSGCPGLVAGLHGVQLGKPISLHEQAMAMEAEWAKLLDKLEEKDDREDEPVAQAEWDALDAVKPWNIPEGWRADIKQRMLDRQSFNKGWRPAAEVLRQKAKQRPGVLKEDRRPSVRANRAGTRGFRAPEVLLKCPDQTVGLDIWSVGIIMLCFLTRRFPFFNSNDDTEALAEITAIFGKKKMELCAALHNRTFQSNIPDYDDQAHANLHELVRELNPPIVVENSPDPYGTVPSSTTEINKWYKGSGLFQCVDLMKRCLDLDCTARWTAQECLEHPFFTGDYDIGLGRTVYRENAFTSA